MNKFALAAGLLVLGTAAHAGTYSIDGVTVSIQDGCMSERCIAVSAPGYGFYDGAIHRGRSLTKLHPHRMHKRHKDQPRVASTTKANPATAPVDPHPNATPVKLQDAAPQTEPSFAAPVK